MPKRGHRSSMPHGIYFEWRQMGYCCADSTEFLGAFDVTAALRDCGILRNGDEGS